MPQLVRAITRIQDADDAPILGSGQNGYALTWDNATARFVAVERDRAVGVITVAASNASAIAGAADYTCDGVADNVQIQAAIDLATVTGGIVQLSDGLFDLAATINLKSNVKLFGVGDSTILKATAALDSLTGIVENASGATRFEICDLTINGNAAGMSAGLAGDGIRLANATYASLRRLNFINVGQSKASLRVCIVIEATCADIFIDEARGISVQATPTLWYGVYDGGAARTVLQNCYFYGFGDEPVVFFNSQDFKWIGGRVCYGADNTAGNGSHGCHITATSGSCRGTIIGVESDHNYDDGFRIDIGGGGITDVTIFGCNVHHNGNIGISCGGSGRIMFNRCYDNGGGAGSTDAGIYIAAANCLVTGNYCYNNVIAGIYAGTGAIDLMIEGNICTNIGGSAQNYGIITVAGTSDIVMIGNNCLGNATSQIDIQGTAISLFDWTGSALNVSGLPTVNPAVAGRPWLNSGVLTISSG